MLLANPNKADLNRLDYSSEHKVISPNFFRSSSCVIRNSVVYAKMDNGFELSIPLSLARTAGLVDYSNNSERHHITEHAVRNFWLLDGEVNPNDGIYCVSKIGLMTEEGYVDSCYKANFRTALLYAKLKYCAELSVCFITLWSCLIALYALTN